MSGSTNRESTRRRTREEVIELFRACAAKLEKTPGRAEFEKMCGVAHKDVSHHFWKGGYTELAEVVNFSYPKREPDHRFSANAFGRRQHPRSEQILAQRF